MVLADSPAWIEFHCATGSPADARLTQAIGADEPPATTGIALHAPLTSVPLAR